MLEKQISEKEFKYLSECIDIAKDLLECDVTLRKLGKADPEMKMGGF